MPFDARQEDYLRLSVRFGQTLDGMSPSEAMHAYAGFGRRFARDRDSLPQTDADRAFHLVAQAATLIDYELPFADDVRARSIIDRGHDLLSEALSIDPACFDAQRMMAASEQVGFDNFYDYLAEREGGVEERCRREGEAAAVASGEGRAEVAHALALRPYLRWLGTMASQALICGRNREALAVCERALAADPSDEVGVRFTAALAYAKLEDAAGLDSLVRRAGGFSLPQFEASAWIHIASAALAYKRDDLYEGDRQLAMIADRYPHGCAALIRQHEMPEGVFSRVVVKPFSEDELTLALSEATVLLQEGREVGGRGPFGAWVADEAERMSMPQEQGEIAEAKRFAAEKAERFARQEGGYGPGFDGYNGYGSGVDADGSPGGDGEGPEPSDGAGKGGAPSAGSDPDNPGDSVPGCEGGDCS